MVTMHVETKGSAVHDFKHYLFGGLVSQGAQVPTNDVIEVRTRFFVSDKFYQEENWHLGGKITDYEK